MGLAVDPEEFAEVTIYFSGKSFKTLRIVPPTAQFIKHRLSRS